MYANDNQPCDLNPTPAAHELAAGLVRARGAAHSDQVEQLADELVEGRLACQNPEFGIAVIDELRAMAGALRAEERSREPRCFGFPTALLREEWRAPDGVTPFAPNPALRQPLVGSRRPKVCFLFIAQQHQILHGVSLAIELARSGRFDVHVAGVTEQHLDYVRSLVDRLGGGPISYHRLWPQRLLPSSGRSIPPKAIALAMNLHRLRQFEVIVTPERSSLMLKRMGLRDQIFIHTDHGAGDRAVGYEPRIALFDLVLLAGEKQRRRMSEAGVIREGGYAVVGYPKFDVVDVLPPQPKPLFAEPRPVVLYNPHFHGKFSSWPRFGRAVLEQFAVSRDYNLIFAPHVRLFDGAPAAARGAVERFAQLPNIHVDLGGDRAWDMTYTNLAEVYLGDVSSQVYEFLRRPRPCLFLDAQGLDWEGDDNYAHWKLGPVIGGVDHLCARIDEARFSHAFFAPAQEAAFAETFDLLGSSSQRAARAVTAYLDARLGLSARQRLLG